MMVQDKFQLICWGLKESPGWPQCSVTPNLCFLFQYSSCTTDGDFSDGKPWCSVTSHFSKHHLWGFCTDSSSPQQPGTPVNPAQPIDPQMSTPPLNQVPPINLPLPNLPLPANPAAPGSVINYNINSYNHYPHPSDGSGSFNPFPPSGQTQPLLPISPVMPVEPVGPLDASKTKQGYHLRNYKSIASFSLYGTDFYDTTVYHTMIHQLQQSLFIFEKIKELYLCIRFE